MSSIDWSTRTITRCTRSPRAQRKNVLTSDVRNQIILTWIRIAVPEENWLNDGFISRNVIIGENALSHGNWFELFKWLNIVTNLKGWLKQSTASLEMLHWKFGQVWTILPSLITINASKKKEFNKNYSNFGLCKCGHAIAEKNTTISCFMYASNALLWSKWHRIQLSFVGLDKLKVI